MDDPLRSLPTERRRDVIRAVLKGKPVEQPEDAPRAVALVEWTRRRYLQGSFVRLILPLVVFVGVPVSVLLSVFSGDPLWIIIATDGVAGAFLGAMLWWFRRALPSRLDRAESSNRSLSKNVEQ